MNLRNFDHSVLFSQVMKAFILNSKGKKKEHTDRERKNMIIFISNKNVWGEIKAKCANSLTPLWDVHATGGGYLS